MIRTVQRIINIRICGLRLKYPVYLDYFFQRLEVRVYAQAYRSYQCGSYSAGFLRVADGLDLSAGDISHYLHPWLTLGTSAYNPELRQRQFELFLYDFHNPPDVISHAFINGAKHVLAGMLRTQVEKGGTDITVVNRRSFSV